MSLDRRAARYKQSMTPIGELKISQAVQNRMIAEMAPFLEYYKNRNLTSDGCSKVGLKYVNSGIPYPHIFLWGMKNGVVNTVVPLENRGGCDGMPQIGNQFPKEAMKMHKKGIIPVGLVKLGAAVDQRMPYRLHGSGNVTNIARAGGLMIMYSYLWEEPHIPMIGTLIPVTQEEERLGWGSYGYLLNSRGDYLLYNLFKPVFVSSKKGTKETKKPNERRKQNGKSIKKNLVRVRWRVNASRRRKKNQGRYDY